MTDAASMFAEVLAEIDASRRPSAVEREYQWRADYLTRDAVFYEFTGSCHMHVQTGTGCRLDASRGSLTDLAPHLVLQTLANFEENNFLRFYVGRAISMSEIAREAMGCFDEVAESVTVEILNDWDENAHRSRTRLAFVGLSFEPPSAGKHPKLSDELLHPYWCRERMEPRLVLDVLGVR